MSKNDIKTRVKAFAKRLSDSARDEYYDSPVARLDTIIGAEKDYAVRLRSVKSEWDEQWNAGFRESNFPQYLMEEYGIRMKMAADGVDLSYEIVDEKKHTLFLLKFGA
jgi:hypothetical protein